MSSLKLINASCADQNVDVVVNAANDRLWARGGNPVAEIIKEFSLCPSK